MPMPGDNKRTIKRSKDVSESQLPAVGSLKGSPNDEKSEETDRERST